jgi:predicted transcriptional regulator
VLEVVVAAVTAMKLTDADITVVKELLFEQHLTCREVALLYNVDVTTAWR